MNKRSIEDKEWYELQASGTRPREALLRLLDRHGIERIRYEALVHEIRMATGTDASELKNRVPFGPPLDGLSPCERLIRILEALNGRDWMERKLKEIDAWLAEARGKR